MKKLFFATVASLSASLFAMTGATTAYGSISVEGSGTINAVADIAVLNLGVRSQNQNISVALSNSSEAIARISSMLEDKEISGVFTSSFSIWEGWDISPLGEGVQVHEVTNNLTVRVSDFDLINPIIELAVAAGANNIWASFESSNAIYYRERALELAISNAVRRAEVIANALDVNLGSIVAVSDEGSFAPPTIFSSEARSDFQAHISHPGQVQISATVRMTFE